MPAISIIIQKLTNPLHYLALNQNTQKAIKILNCMNNVHFSHRSKENVKSYTKSDGSGNGVFRVFCFKFLHKLTFVSDYQILITAKVSAV